VQSWKVCTKIQGKKCKVGKYAPKCVGKSAKAESMHQNPRKKVQKPKSMHQNPEKSKNNRNTAPKGNQIIIPYSIKPYFEKKKNFQQLFIDEAFTF